MEDNSDTYEAKRQLNYDTSTEDVDHSKVGENKESTHSVKDNYNYAYIVFLLLGIVVVLPWNALIQSLDFLEAKIPDRNISFVVATIANAPIFLAQMLMLKFSGKFDLRKLIIQGLVVMSVLGLAIPLLSEYISNVNTLWILILIVLTIFCLSNGVFQSGSYGYAGGFPPRMIASLGNGGGLSGVIIGIGRAISLLSFPTNNGDLDDRNLFKGTMLYFSLASFCCVLGIALFLILMHTQYNKHYTQAGSNTKSRISSVTGALLLNYSEIAPSDIDITPAEVLKGESLVGDDQVQQASILQIHNRYWIIIWGITINNVINFCVFPGVLLEAPLNFISDPNWKSWLVIMLFNVFDTVGRVISGIYMMKSTKVAGILTVARVVFIAFAFLSAYEVGIFKSDFTILVNNILMSATSGYLVNCQMIMGGSYPKPHEREISSKMMNFALVFGILIGSLIASFGISKLF